MENLITKLQNIGLSNSEAKIYLLLIKNKLLSASEIAKLAELSRTQVYKILDILIQKNICLETRGNIKKYKPVSPQKVLKKISSDIEKQKQTVHELDSELDEMYNENPDDLPADFIQILNTKSSIITHVEKLEEDSREIVLAFNKPPYMMNIGESDLNQISAEVRSPEQEGLEKGVKFKSLYEVEPGNFVNFIKKVENFELMGEEVKISWKLPFKLFVFDRKTVFLALRKTLKNNADYMTMTIEHPDFALALEEIFEIYWKKSMTIKEFKEKIEE